MKFRVEGLGLDEVPVWDLGLRVSGLGFRGSRLMQTLQGLYIKFGG